MPNTLLANFPVTLPILACSLPCEKMKKQEVHISYQKLSTLFTCIPSKSKYPGVIYYRINISASSNFDRPMKYLKMMKNLQ